MPSSPASHSPTSILTVVVLYNCELAQSQSFSSLFDILQANPEPAKHFSLLLYDNSPQPQSHMLSAGFPIHYIHDPSNGGLASAYNAALDRAEAERREWLLLLDQDTSLTTEFILELLEITTRLQAETEVASVVPKLRVNGRIDSPVAEFLALVRRQFSSPEPVVSEDLVGIQQQRLSAYNSGSTLRVSALRSIGGFPPEFWLDFLDHVIFHALYVSGYRMYVMRAILAHDSSYSDVRSLPVWRLHNILLARSLYVQRNGAWMDRLLYRVWLLRHSRNLRQCCKDPRIWKEAMRHALQWKIGSKDKRLLT
jgi:GT2 family glycosyltransferase